MFKVTAKFKAAIELINGLSAEKFPLLLTRIIERLSTDGESAFTSEEEARLQSMLSLSVTQLHTVLEASAFIFEQAAYQAVGASDLLGHLTEAGMSESQAAATVMVWRDNSTSLLERLRERTLGGPKVLTDSRWRMHLHMGQSGLTKLKEPSAIFEMHLADPNSSADGSESANEQFQVEFSHEELYAFFLKMDRIQEQLDALT